MFGISISEYLLIIIVAVLVLEPKHLPKALHTVTKLISNFRHITVEVQRIINNERLETESLFQSTSNRNLKKKKIKNTSPEKQTSHPTTSYQQTEIFQLVKTKQRYFEKSQQTSLLKKTKRTQHNTCKNFGRNISSGKRKNITISSNLNKLSIEKFNTKKNIDAPRKISYRKLKDLS